MQLHKRRDDEEPADEKLYREIVGSLGSLSTYTRPYLSFAVSKLSQYLSNPSIHHIHADCDISKAPLTLAFATIRKVAIRKPHLVIRTHLTLPTPTTGNLIPATFSFTTAARFLTHPASNLLQSFRRWNLSTLGPRTLRKERFSFASCMHLSMPRSTARRSYSPTLRQPHITSKTTFPRPSVAPSPLILRGSPAVTFPTALTVTRRTFRCIQHYFYIASTINNSMKPMKTFVWQFEPTLVPYGDCLMSTCGLTSTLSPSVPKRTFNPFLFPFPFTLYIRESPFTAPSFTVYEIGFRIANQTSSPAILPMPRSFSSTIARNHI